MRPVCLSAGWSRADIEYTVGARASASPTVEETMSDVEEYDLVVLTSSLTNGHHCPMGTPPARYTSRSLDQADGCQPASAQSSPLTAELQIMK